MFTKSILKNKSKPKYGAPFIMTIRTTTPNETFQWPNRAGIRDGYIDFGDGYAVKSTGNLQPHTYALPGLYDIKVYGTYTAPYFNYTGDKLKVRDIKQWGNVLGMTDWNVAFYGCSNLGIYESPTFQYGISAIDSPRLTFCHAMFYNCSNLEFPTPLNWNVSNVTNMNSMFQTCTNLGKNFEFDISNWNVSNVTNMNFMFQNATNFNSNISNWCVTKIPSLPSNFKVGSALTDENTPVWGTCPGS